MKLATLKNGSRDGALVVVSRDLSHAVQAGAVASTLQRAMETGTRLRPTLQNLGRRTLTREVHREPSRSTRFPRWRHCHAPTSGATARPL